MINTKRLLISAYGCEPGLGSEQGVGWNWVLEIARFSEVVVITRTNNRLAIEADFPDDLKGKVSFEYYDLPQSIKKFKRKEKGLYIYYLLWQWGAYLRAKKVVAQSNFDYVMHLTFGSIWLPTFMHWLPIPLIFGPVGGGEAVPFRLISTLPFLARVSQYLRYVLMSTFSVNPFIMSVIKRSEFIIARTDDTARLIPKKYSHKVSVMLETAISDGFSVGGGIAHGDAKNNYLRVIYTGRLIAIKNVATALYAVARAKAHGVSLRFIIVGDGPLRDSLISLVKKLGITQEVEFKGKLLPEQVVKELLCSDVYLFPSLKEGGVWSLMEAMAVGLPVVCVNSSGMRVITDEKSAIRIDPISQEKMVEGFSNALISLSPSLNTRRKIGRAAQKRIEDNFNWRKKGEFFQRLLNQK
jgi:glycosyltransferase involved in cell wall biosynthesis